MKFRINKDAKNNASRLLDSVNVHQYENGRVSVTGRISGRQAPWEGSLGTSVVFDDLEAEAWLLTQNIDWIRYGRWLDAARAEQAQRDAQAEEDRKRRQESTRQEMAIVRAAEQKFAVAVREGVMQFDPLPQIASVPGEDGRKWVQAWVLVEVPA
jgi:hypothetical protein